MAFNKSDKSEGLRSRRPGGGMRRRKKLCTYCSEDDKVIDYKDTAYLKI